MIGFSDEHATLVDNVRHLSTHFISPQFHLVFEDLFETVNGFGVSGDAVEPMILLVLVCGTVTTMSCFN